MNPCVRSTSFAGVVFVDGIRPFMFRNAVLGRVIGHQAGSGVGIDVVDEQELPFVNSLNHY